MNNQLENLSNSVAFFVVRDRNGIINLLKNNGLVFDENFVTDEKLTNMIFNSLFDDSSNFKNNYLAYINEKVNLDNKFSNVPGPIFSSTPLPTFNPSTSSSSSTLGSSSSNGFFGGFNANSALSLVTTGLGFLGSAQAGKDQRAIAEAQAQATIAAAQANAQNNATQLQIAQLQLEAQKAAPNKSNNTILYVVIGIAGIAIIGGIIFATSKK